MEYIGSLIDSVIANFDFAFMLVVNIITYYAVKGIDKFNGNNGVTRTHKRIITLVSTFVLILVYTFIANYENTIVLINSAILAPISWNIVIKPILKSLGIDYSKIQNNIE